MVPLNIEGKEALLEFLSKALNFLEYFGNNWDALEDMFNNLTWIKGNLALAHQELPKLEKDDLKIYLSILNDTTVSHKLGNLSNKSLGEINYYFPEVMCAKIETMV